jgi:hypothetical protein
MIVAFQQPESLVFPLSLSTQSDLFSLPIKKFFFVNKINFVHFFLDPEKSKKKARFFPLEKIILGTFPPIQGLYKERT